MNLAVSLHGPVFDGRADAEIEGACERAEQRIATLGASMIRTELAHVLRNESTPPFYRFKNEATPDRDGWKIWDNNVIYGNWLEGTGSRNRTTRFKGYWTYRRTFQKIEARALPIAEYTIDEAIARING